LSNDKFATLLTIIATMSSSEAPNPKHNIIIKGARLHNLKNIDLVLPHKKLIVITGLSGSGKSTLAFDTLYAEGQRRYIESLSSYARQFLGKIDKPEVDSILGVAPAIAINQKVKTSNPRSTVGTTTEIFDYLKLLYARIGRTFSPVSGNEVKRHTVDSIAQFILDQKAGEKVMVFAPFGTMPSNALEKRIEILQHQGYTRVLLNNEVVRLDKISKEFIKKEDNDLSVLIDRFVTDSKAENTRVAEAIRTALAEGHNRCTIQIGDNKTDFSTEFEADGMRFEEPSVHFFSFNNPYGACKRCEGFGNIIGIDEDLVMPDRALSIFEEGIVCWRGESMSKYKDQLVRSANKFDFPIHRPIYDLTEEQVQLLWDGNEYFEGLHVFFRMLEENSYKIQYRVMLSRYRGKTPCPECKGTKLRKDANYVQIGGKSLSELVLMPIFELADFFDEVELTDTEREISKRILKEITSRLGYMKDVGLGYLNLNRQSNTLSGGESQRIHLASSLGSSLVGSMYILDEPSIGLHPKDTERLISILKQLRDIGNTVIVVEHDEDIMLAADMIVDIGPEAGTNGGEVVYQGSLEQMMKSADTLTTGYLNGKLEIPVPEKRRKSKGKIHVLGARQHNLKGIDVTFPLGCLSVITGVSGSGKSTLMKSILYPSLRKRLGGYGLKTGQFERLDGDLERIKDVEFVDQDPIGRSTRSNPVTYIKAYDEIRALFAGQKAAQLRGYKPKHFSFNVAGGRCEVCEGEGTVKIEMQFMADIVMKCESCEGHRFKQEVLEIKFQDKTIHDILSMTVDESMEFFTEHNPKVAKKIAPLQEVGLGYVQLGQSSSTLSGGEAQRIKLASFLTKGKNAGNTLFIFDEPTTGLHFHDIHKLLKAFNALLDNGHSIILIEHHPDVIKCADHVIDLGPEGGKNGGTLVFEGTPEELAKCKESATAKSIAEKVFSKAKG
jgi:excinuclease ABC subunit A